MIPIIFRISGQGIGISQQTGHQEAVDQVQYQQDDHRGEIELAGHGIGHHPVNPPENRVCQSFDPD